MVFYYRKHYLLLIIFFSVAQLWATRAVYNETEYSLYVAGYHAGDSVMRVTNIYNLPPNNSINVNVPRTNLLSTKKRYLVVARRMDELPQTMSLGALKALPHKNMLNPSPSFYLLDKEDGRLRMYNMLEHSTVIRKLKELGGSAKETFVDAIIDKNKLPAVIENKYRNQVAHVRTGNEIPLGERIILQTREPKMRAALEQLLGKSLAGKKTPRIALVMSGGGNRAMFGACGYTWGAQEIGLLDATSYVVGLSGSSWFLGAWYASNKNIVDFKNYLLGTMVKGISSFSLEELNLFVDAMKVKVAYDEPITLVDIFGGILGNSLLRDYGAKRHMVYWSDQVAKLTSGNWPYPILTAVDGSKQTHNLHKWYEFTPHEVGGAFLGNYAPMWGFGRRYEKGRSVTDDPEIALDFLMGICGSAFAVDVARAWQETHKRFETSFFDTAVRKLVINQIGDTRLSPAEEFNFTVGMPTSPLRDLKKMVMVDAGYSFNLPYPVISGDRPGRAADIIIFIDCSSGTSKIGKSIQDAANHLYKVEKYAQDNRLKFPSIRSVEPKAVNIFKNEQDNSVPLVIWLPLMKDLELLKKHEADSRFAKLKDFDVASCTEDAFCTTLNFTYSPQQAEQLMSVGHFTMHAVKDILVDAIKWKLDHMEQ